MRRLIFVALTGLAVTALTLATPAESRADHRRGSSFSLGIGSGGFQFDYSRGYAGPYYRPGYGTGYGGYYAPVVPGYYTPRPVIVQPTEHHWTPYRGWHEHGQILVPHRGHYHVRPY